MKDDVERDERDIDDMRKDKAITPTPPKKCNLEPRRAKKGHEGNRQR
ncbi:MAG: hypothetical protein MUP81_02525 [Dehalococcoidia bacterium]|nr:hypothetical protein [Dehalococcoidia bacterium]